MSRFDTFVSMMERTTSPNEHEALIALRKANKVLLEMNMSWGELLYTKKAIADETYKIIPTDNDSGEKQGTKEAEDAVSAKLDFLAKVVTGGFRDFILSVRDQYIQRGMLTPRQLDAVNKAYDRHQTNAPF